MKPKIETLSLAHPRDESVSVDALLSAARRHLRADIAFLAEFRGESEIIRRINGNGDAVDLHEGTAYPLSETYCYRVVNGGLPRLVPDAGADERVRDLAGTRQLRIGTYVGVPVQLGYGHIYGTLCCISHEPDPSIQERDVKLIEILADIIGEQLALEEGRTAPVRDKRARIQRSIDNAGPRMVFQPLVDLDTGATVGYEALARFDSEPRRTPDRWFAEAWQVGLGMELEILAIRAAIARLPELAPEQHISVNASPITLQSNIFFEALSEADPERIVVEVTEHDATDEYQPLLQARNRLKERGFRLAIDDVGAGYAGLSHIVQLKPDILKLDMSLTRGVQADRGKQAIASALVAFAARMGMQVTAEGIETAQDAMALQVLGIHFGQGYYYGRPSELAEAANA